MLKAADLTIKACMCKDGQREFFQREKVEREGKDVNEVPIDYKSNLRTTNSNLQMHNNTLN